MSELKFKKGDRVIYTPETVARFKDLQENNPPREVLGYDDEDGQTILLVVLKSICAASDCHVFEDELMLYPSGDQNANVRQPDGKDLTL